ncbi:MAG: MoxR family ATPase [Alcanivoracaceae bacterium]|nr:MoxR family ATPase [Alcanivoracaceae bacterium]
MAEKQVSIDGNTYKLKPPFFVIATQNPTDEAGTFPLPDSQLDRFTVSISLGYPSNLAERKLYAEDFSENFNTPLSTIINQQQLAAIQKHIEGIHASDEVKDYLQLLIGQTRNHSLLVDGLSPRAGLSMFRLSQAQAFMQGRNFIIPEDVQNAFIPISSHRLRSRSTQQNVLNLLKKILHETRIP